MPFRLFSYIIVATNTNNKLIVRKQSSHKFLFSAPEIHIFDFRFPKQEKPVLNSGFVP